tara:strand:+ start:989 stop:3208 length:2220 start_codon:yes stop_codon:yes gene_type:complete
MAKYILGIQSYANHDSGAAIIKFGKNIEPKIIAISEERVLRKKYPYTFPIHSILYCMKYFKINKLNEIDLIISDWIREKKWLRSGPSYNYQAFDYIKENLDFDKKKIIQISHHLAHAASAYYSSKYKSSAILIVDGNGSDVETNSYFIGKGNKIKLLKNYKYFGIGAAYSAVTKEILNLGTGGEGKTMGLAPYGKFNKKFKIPLKVEGIKTDFSKFMLRMPYSDVLNHLNVNFRPKVIRNKVKKSNKKNVMNKYFKDYAYMIQNSSEKVMKKLGEDLYKITKEKNICLAGGVALNSVANEKMFQANKFKEMFVFPACSDSGIPFGLVIWAYHNIFKQNKRIPFDNAYTGINYSDNEIIYILNKFKIKFKKTSIREIAKLISEGNIIGNFQGKSEYGPRALGNRSILADPRKKNIRDFINKHIKHREIFRPFAPAIIEEESLKYFNIKISPFMLRVTKCKKRHKIPATLHVDNTARVQTVNKKQNQRFYSIIKEFQKITKIPVLLNTSFNDAGEPLVEDPLDGIISALKTNLHYIVLENNLINLKELNFSNKKFLLKKLKIYKNSQIKKNEAKAIKKITKRFVKSELKKKIRINNKFAQNYCLKRVFEKTEKYLRNFDYNKKLIIVGSNDHTNILIKLFCKEFLKIKNIYYFECKNNDIYKNKKRIIFFKKLKKINYKFENSEFFVSSFQYMSDLNKILKKYNNQSKIFLPYDSSSRSLIDYFYVKKYKGNNKMYSKEIF